MHNRLNQALSLSMAVSMVIGYSAATFAAPGQINSVNDGRDIRSGAYYNTSDSQTLFKNSGRGGLWLHSGSTLKILETNATGARTGNGGTAHFSAPNSVVRLDGLIDASGLKQGTVFIGNGGRVIVDAAYLYQNGQIFANGINGGYVSYNVGAATFGPQARILAMGFGGNGGKIDVNGTGVVDIQPGVVMDTRGRVIGNYDTNVIHIEAGMVNDEGILQATGAIAGQNGGQVHLVSNGNTDVTTPKAAIDDVNNVPGLAPVFTTEETNAIKSQMDYLKTMHDGHVHHLGTIRVNGADGSVNGKAADGGQILVDTAAGHFHNHGLLQANGGYGTNSGTGGNGGNITVNSPFHIINEVGAVMEANGGNGITGGKGGTILLQAVDNVVNFGDIHANGGVGRQGGDGGSVTLHGTRMINLTGPVSANGGDGLTPGQDGIVQFLGTTNIEHDPNDNGMTVMP